jgi:hypothetical protein
VPSGPAAGALSRGAAPARIPAAISAAVTASPEGFPPQDLRSFLELCDGEWLALRSHFDLALVEDAAPDPAMTADGSAQTAAVSAPEAGAVAVSPGQGGGADNSGEPSAGQSVTDTVGTSAGAGAASNAAADSGSDGLPDFAALLQQARAEVEEAPSEEAWHSSERAELLVAFLAPEQADQPGGLRVTPPGGGSRELHFRADGSFAGAADQAPVPAGHWQLWPDGSLELILEAPGRVLRERIWFTQPNLRLRSSVEHATGGQPGRARFSSEIRRVRKPAA